MVVTVLILIHALIGLELSVNIIIRFIIISIIIIIVIIIIIIAIVVIVIVVSIHETKTTKRHKSLTKLYISYSEVLPERMTDVE